MSNPPSRPEVVSVGQGRTKTELLWTDQSQPSADTRAGGPISGDEALTLRVGGAWDDTPLGALLASEGPRRAPDSCCFQRALATTPDPASDGVACQDQMPIMSLDVESHDLTGRDGAQGISLGLLIFRSPADPTPHLITPSHQRPSFSSSRRQRRPLEVQERARGSARSRCPARRSASSRVSLEMLGPGELWTVSGYTIHPSRVLVVDTSWLAGRKVSAASF